MKEYKPKIVFTTPILHHPPVGGPTLRIENSMKALSQISDLYIYSQAGLSAIGGEKAINYYRQLCKEFHFAPSKKPLNWYEKVIDRLKGYFHKLLKQDRKAINFTRDANALLKLAGRINPDCIWLGYGNITYPLLKYIKENSNYKVVVDTDSVWSRFVMRGLPFANTEDEIRKIKREGEAKEIEEEWGTKLADVTTAVSEIDAQYYRNLTNNPQRVLMFSNVIDVSAYEAVPNPAPDLKKPCIYLAGTFWKNSPMEDAARWVIDHVLPIVREQIQVHCYIVGKGSDKVLSDIADSEITITGQLSSVLPYLCHVDVALVPLRFESGTRFKILEAGVCGIPVVSTTLGAEGLPVAHEKDILIADEPEQFASSIIRLIQDRSFAGRLAKNLKKLVEENNSIPALEKEGLAVLQYLQSLDTNSRLAN